MSWTLLPTDYTDAVWSGLKRYTQIDNSDGTVSFNDVTTYTNKEKSFFGAKDANKMNQALNYIMSMLENGTDLYEEFQTYFATQQTLFTAQANTVIENVRTLTNAQYDAYVVYLTGLKNETDSSLAEIEQTYEEHMTSYESEQKAAFDAWFAAIQESLSEDVAGSLQNQITEVEERLSSLEYMTLQNDFSVPLEVQDTDGSILADDLGYAIVADWKYKEV